MKLSKWEQFSYHSLKSALHAFVNLKMCLALKKASKAFVDLKASITLYKFNNFKLFTFSRDIINLEQKL